MKTLLLALCLFPTMVWGVEYTINVTSADHVKEILFMAGYSPVPPNKTPEEAVVFCRDSAERTGFSRESAGVVGFFQKEPLPPSWWCVSTEDRWSTELSAKLCVQFGWLLIRADDQKVVCEVKEDSPMFPVVMTLLEHRAMVK